MKRIIRIMMLLAAMTVTAGQAWARGGTGNLCITTGTVEGGTLTYYKTYEGGTLSDEIGINNNVAVAGAPIYIKATPAFGYTVTDMTATNFNIVKSGNTSNAEAPIRRSNSIGVNITVNKEADGIFSFTMPADKSNVIVSATFAEKAKNTAAISYIDADGSTKTKTIGSVYVLDGTETTLGKSGSETWYVCNSTTGLAYASTLALDGNVHLVLADGTAMSAATISGSGKTLNIYAQPGQTGQMLADAYQCNVSFGQRFVAYIDEASASAIVSGKNTDALPSFTLADINGKTLKPLDGYTVTAAGGISIVGKTADFTITKDANTTTYYIYKASTQQAPVSVTLNYGGQGLVTLGGLPDGTSPNAVANQPMQRSFAMPAEDVALTTTAVTGLAANGTYNYDGTAQTPAIKMGDVAIDAANYTVSGITAKQGSALTDGTAVNAGSYTVTITGLGQYIGTASVDFTIGKVDYDGTKTASVNVYSNQATTDETLTLPTLPDGASYAAAGTIGGNNSGLISGTPSISGRTLLYSTTAQETGANATITIGVAGATNYNDYEVVVTVTVTDKGDAGVTINGGTDKTVKFGDADFTLAKTVTAAGSGTGTWTWTSSDTDVAIVGESTGTITIKKTGSTTIKAQYESESTKGEATMTLTVEAKDIDYANGTITLDENGYTVNLDEDNGSVNTLPDDAELVNLTYKRTLTAPGTNKGDITIDDKAARLYTVCLPFAPITGTAVKYYTLSSVDGPVLHFDEVGTPVANTPYLVAVFGNANFTENCADMDVTSTAINSTTVDGYTFNGTFTGLSHAKAVGKYILQPDSKWRQVESSGTVKIPPFRAYIEAQTNAPDLMDGTVGGNVTGIDSIRMTDADGTEHWYDLNGCRVSKPATKGIYIRGGKKVVVK